MIKQILFFILLSGLFISPAYANKPVVNVAMASNLIYVMPEIVKSFKKNNKDIQIKLSLASTGNLYTQILNGAPFDIFLAADKKRPSLLAEKNLIKGKPFQYAMGSLILWSSKKLDSDPDWHKVLLSDQVKKIAIANDKHAPYGLATKQLLKTLHLWSKLKNKLVIAENIGQVAHFVYSGGAQAGFVAESVLKSNKLQGGRFYNLPQNLYNPVWQWGVVLKKSIKQTGLFKAFLLSRKAQDIFKSYGYKVKTEKK